MDLEQIKKIIEKDIPEGISSKLSLVGKDVIISDNIHQAGSIDMLHAANEMNKIIRLLLMYGYVYECLQSPTDVNASYKIKITGKNEVDESTILTKKQQTELLEKISEIKEKNIPDIQTEFINLINRKIDEGFDINTEIKDDIGYTKTLLERLSDYDKVVSYLINQGADVKKYGEKVLSSLLSRSENYIFTFPIAKILIDAGANINDSAVLYEVVKKCGNKDKNSDYYGIVDYYKKCYEVFDYLLAKGADPNVQIYNGETSLMIAVENENIYLIRQLLKYGADKSLKSEYDRNPLDHVKNPVIKKLLSIK